MNHLSAALLTALALAVLLSAGVAWAIAGLYRRRMVALMRGAPPPDAAHPPAPVEPSLQADRPAAVLNAAAHRRAESRLLAALAALCLAIGLAQSWLAILFIYDDLPFSLNRLLILGAVYAWPMVLAWGLIRRWSWGRVVAGIGAYMTAMAGLVMLGSTEAQTLAGVAGWLGGVVAIPLLTTLVIGASGRIRAVGPYLLPPFLILAGVSMGVLLALSGNVDHPPGWLYALVGRLGAWGSLALLVLGPWLLLAWPVYALGRWLARAYREKRFSDFGYLFAAYWFVVLTASALPAAASAGPAAFSQWLPWLLIPPALPLLGRWLPARGAPPTLLVLRVFQRDAAVEALFDQVVERWRLTGNTLLIAGTDLVSRTLDPDDLFAFVSGRLAQRFIASEAEIPRRLAELDEAPDPDGRYRVNECYCFDTTWQAALRALVGKSDVVLMDLRGFRAENRGCRFELAELAEAAHLARVVLLYDGATDRHAAAFDLAGAPADRFHWIEAGRLTGAKTGQVLGALFG